jgi:hypothetical protein
MAKGSGLGRKHIMQPSFQQLLPQQDEKKQPAFIRSGVGTSGVEDHLFHLEAYRDEDQ